MALLPQIQYGNPVEDGVNLYNAGLKLGTQQREQNALRDVGQLLAAGNQKGARNALYGAGMVDQGLKLDDRMTAQADKAQARALAMQERRQALALKAQGALANIADTIQTPEQFEMAKGMLANAGMDVSKYTFDQLPILRAQAIDAKTRMELALKEQAIEAQAARANTPKPRNLSFGDINKLSEKGTRLEDAKRYVDTFADESAGYGMGGNAMMGLARNFSILTGPQTEAAATWWQDYDRYKNQVRNELFGSALTAPEKAAFEQADISPNMDPKMIRSNLDRQKEAVKSALRKTSGALKKSGYSGEAVDAALGTSDEDLAPTQATETPAKVLPRPKGVSDAQIVAEARKAVAAGKDKEEIRKRLDAWGIKF